MRSVRGYVRAGTLVALMVAGCGREDGGATAWEGDDERAEAMASQEVRATPWEDARERGVDFRGIGQEPGWFVEIDDEGRMLVALDYGERRITVPTPEPERGGNGDLLTYRAMVPADRVVVEIRREACQDIMSGEAFEASVRARVDGEEFRGCGRFLQRERDGSSP